MQQLAATKSDAESAYKENKQPKQSAKPHKRIRQTESAAKPLEKEKQRKKAEKGKQATEKKKSQAQEDRELKASIQKAQREQMKEVLKETNELNYELISDYISDDDDDVPVTPFHSCPKITVPKAAIPRNTDQSCCQVTVIKIYQIYSLPTNVQNHFLTSEINMIKNYTFNSPRSNI